MRHFSSYGPVDPTRASASSGARWSRRACSSSSPIDSLALPDPDDRHVLAAAIHAGATVIVTFNLRDFPSETLSALGVRALHPDDFVLERIEAAPGLACIALQDQLASLSRPPVTRPELLSRLASQGLPRSAARLGDLLSTGA
jgi:hypothetical protein